MSWVSRWGQSPCSPLQLPESQLDRHKRQLIAASPTPGCWHEPGWAGTLQLLPQKPRLESL